MFQLKLFDIAVKYGQGRLEWYEQLYHHAHFDIYHIYGV